MRILIIGGTAFVGRHLAQAALTAGHDVTLFHRGRTGRDLFPQATHLTGDRDQDLSALANRKWDATVDVCGYLPRQVRALAAVLGARGGQHVFISSTSAYRTPIAPGFTEQNAPLAELADPTTEVITDQTYGGLKVACERAAAELYDATTIVRPTYVIGPHDYTCRFPWWVQRIARGGTVLAPGDASDPIQVIDARDLADWVVSLIARSVTGTFHAVSPAPPFGFGDLLAAISSQVAPPGTELAWVGKDFLLAAGETDASLPLWPGGDSERDINAADPAAAYAAGLQPRPIEQSIAEIHAAELKSPTPAGPGIGLAPDREAELLDRWRASAPTS
ncbi:MAG TPA: NAD-dependent epimerase/dehydratase family protein [Streptosporangiaceae bacterium]|nr:NAD-dependent epimerase/dehydratase family protein [Streptosporangiaceae bacterium]